MFWNLIHPYGLRRLNVRGLAGTHKTMLLTVIAYNLKKLHRYQLQQLVGAAVALPKPLLAANARACLRNRRSKPPTRAFAVWLARNRTT